MSHNYYYYISEAKVDMLLPQIPESELKKRAVEYGFDIKVFKTTYKEESTLFDNKVAKLLAVEKFLLQQRDEIGSLDRPSNWIEMEGKVKILSWDDGAVFFVGKKDQTVFGFGGSAKHIIGNQPTATIQKPYSYLRWITEKLLELGEGRKSFLNNLLLDPWTKELLTAGVGDGFNAWLKALDSAIQTIEPTQRVKILAKTLAAEKENGTLYILGSPLYVSLTEDFKRFIKSEKMI